MRVFKVVCILLFLVISIFGCKSDQPPREVQMDNFEISHRVVSKDNDTNEVYITIQNNTGYIFLPSGVFLKPHILTETSTNTYSKEQFPVLLDLVLDSSSEDMNYLTYKLSLKNSLLESLDVLGKNSLEIDIRGHFLNQQGIIINSISGFGGIITVNLPNQVCGGN